MRNSKRGERASVANPLSLPGNRRLNPKLEIQHWSTDRLVPYSRNLRKNEQAVGRMIASIQEFGFKIPILARGSGDVVDGHLRLKAAQKLGLVEVPVILCDEWTEAQVKGFRLMVNRSATWADWDTELVALEMEDLRAADFDLALTGFAPLEIDNFLFPAPKTIAEEQIPELARELVTRLGDRWRCGEHLVLCGDATSKDAVQLLLANVSPVLMVTDPPYGVSMDPSWRERAGWASSAKWE